MARRPLRLKDAAIRSATIGDQPARLIFSADKGYWVLVEKKGKEPERIELVLEYSKAFTKQPGTNSVEFDAPQAPVNRWQIRIAEPGVKVNVHPNISATDAARRTWATRTTSRISRRKPKKETLVQAFVGAADVVRIDWTAKAEGAAGLAALVTVQARQEVTIDEGVVRTRANLAYDITRADVTQLTVEVPADHNVVNVFDPNVQKWEKKTEGPLQTLTITLFQPTRGTQNVTDRAGEIRRRQGNAAGDDARRDQGPGRAGRASGHAGSDDATSAGSRGSSSCGWGLRCAARPRRGRACCRSTRPSCPRRWPSRNGRLPIAMRRCRSIWC